MKNNKLILQAQKDLKVKVTMFLLKKLIRLREVEMIRSFFAFIFGQIVRNVFQTGYMC